MGSLSRIFTANRLAALCTWAAGLAAFILGIVHTLPGSWQNGALAAAGLLTKLVVGVKFLDGAQKYDALTIDAVPGADGVYRVPDSAVTPDGDPPEGS